MFGRPKHVLDVQKVCRTSKTKAGCPKKVWTSKTSSDVNLFGGRQKKLIGRATICFERQTNVLDG